MALLNLAMGWLPLQRCLPPTLRVRRRDTALARGHAIGGHCTAALRQNLYRTSRQRLVDEHQTIK